MGWVRIDNSGFYVEDLPFYNGQETETIKLMDNSAGPFRRWMWGAGQWVEGSPKTAEEQAIDSENALKDDLQAVINEKFGGNCDQFLDMQKTIFILAEAATGNTDAIIALQDIVKSLRIAYDYDVSKEKVKTNAKILEATLPGFKDVVDVPDVLVSK